MTMVAEISLVPNTGGTSVTLALSTTSAPMVAVFSATSEKYAVVTPDTTCFYRMGTGTPVALSNGTDSILVGGQAYRIGPIPPNYKFAFILGSGTGNVYITPDA